MKLSSYTVGLGGALVLLLGGVAGGAPINEQEAVAIAEKWYAAEVNAATTVMPAAEKQARVAASNKHEVSYILGRDNWQRTRKAGDEVAAYVVAFQPSGFVVVSGEDALQPVLVFNATGSFQWDGPGTNYLSHYLGRCVAGAVEQARSTAAGHVTHANWTRMREWLKSGAALPAGAIGPSSPGPSGSGPAGSIYVLWPTAWWNQGDHYNDVCVANNGGNGVPTGCTATAMAIKMRFHQWPWSGNGSHSYNDTWGSIQYSHSVNFGSHTYNWYNMPTNNLTADNADVANLMYDCGVAVDMDYELGGSGAWLYASDMNGYFRYRGTSEIWSGTVSDHTASMSYSIQCGLPVILSSSSHTVVACGYRDTVAPYFFLNVGWGGGGAWYALDGMPGGDSTIDVSYPYSSPNNYAYADTGVSSGGNGDLQTPYKTVSAGQSGVSSGGILWLKTGQYRGAGNTSLILNKPMTIKSYLGAASVGGN